MVGVSGCRGSDLSASAQPLLALERESTIDTRVASIEAELDRITDPEVRLEERRRRFDEEMEALRAGSIDSVDSYEQQLALRNRLMGSDEARADALAASQAVYARHESYIPTAGDLAVSDAERARTRELEDHWARAAAEAEYHYPPPPPMPEDMRERDRRIEEERRRLAASRESGETADEGSSR